MSTLPKSSDQAARFKPPPPDALLDRVDLFRLDRARRLDPIRQADLGQFMTPSPVAAFMASLFELRGRHLRLLDAGAGIGSLTAAWVADVCARKHRPHAVSVTAYELDSSLVDDLATNLGFCEAYAASFGVDFHSDIRQEDFIDAGVDAVRGGLFGTPVKGYDCAILNPPYRKIQTDSRTRRVLASVGAETTNLYAAFLTLVIRLLRPGGELVAITPRSFCNGPYFRPFRKALLETMELRRIHCFESRDRAFSDDDVLQENIIFRAVKTPRTKAMVVVSASTGPEDDSPTRREVEFHRIVQPDDPEQFIHVPTDALSDAITERMTEFRDSLADLGLEVSTGRVVDFRATAHLRSQADPTTVPLIYPGHFADGYVKWPAQHSKRPNALVRTHETEDLLVPPGHYVLVKRFSSKEEKRRIVAVVHDPNRLPPTAVAFENHVNYFHDKGGPLEASLAKGLALFLNSTLVDSYFRDWSGHTQVNAGDLRRLRYPTRDQLESVGRGVGASFPGQDAIDELVEESLLMGRARKGPDPVRAKKRVTEALSILKALGLPREQQNERSALTLLALLNLEPKTPWRESAAPLRGITEMMGFFAQHYGKEYAPNTRETVRRLTVHQFVQAGLAVPNPDKPGRPTNSPQAVYQVEAGALDLLRTFGTAEWEKSLRTYLSSVETLQQRYAHQRAIERIPLTLATGKTITLTPGGQNVLVKQVIDEFCPRFTPGARPIYVGDTGEKWAYFDEEALRALGVAIELHGKMPDVVVHHQAKKWLVLIEAVTSHGPVNPKRHRELQELFANSKAGLVYVTAFLSRRDLTKYLGDIAWETEVWVADAPTHLIHFNGERFLGPT